MRLCKSYSYPNLHRILMEIYTLSIWVALPVILFRF